MSSSSDPALYKTPPGGFKKRRIQHSCDRCKQKKIRCDSAEQASNICTNCIQFNVECTHRLAEARQAKRAEKAREFVEETRSHALERIAKTLPSGSTPSLADCDIDTAKEYIDSILSPSTPYELPEDRTTILTIVVQISSYARKLEDELAKTKSAISTSDFGAESIIPRPVPFQCDMPRVKDEDAENDDMLSESLKRLNFGSFKSSFYGKGSNYMLLSTAIKAKEETDGRSVLAEDSARRPQYWSIFSWQDPPSEPTFFFEFPEPDLVMHLTALYFDKFQISIRMLHRPSFERAIIEGQHLHDRAFGCLLLTVCAVASRYSEDPRVLLEGCHDLSAGWKWIRQIRPFSILTFGPSAEPRVYELQALCNYIVFIQTTSSGDLAWPLLALGVRYAQSVGVHRRGFIDGKLTVEKELWKRAFWVLIAMDTFMTANYGRPRVTSPLDYNQEFPIEVDDEYWEHADPEQCFRQPEGKPSTVTFWIQFLKILRVYGIAQRSTLALNKRGLEGHIWGLPQDDRVILELDSLLNQWIDGIPDHLRWDPDRPDFVFFNQSATIYSLYYWVQIQVHRPFIPTFKDDKNGGLSYSSLAVCTNAARSCIRIVDIQSKKGIVDWTTSQMCIFTSAMVLLLRIWGGSRLGLSSNTTKMLEDVNKCLDIFRLFEKRWQKAGSLVDTMSGLVAATAVPIEPYSSSQKRARTDEGPSHDSQELPGQSGVTVNTPTMDSYIWSLLGSDSLYSSSNPTTSLPLYTEELGQAPVKSPRSQSGTYVPAGQCSSGGEAWPCMMQDYMPSLLPLHVNTFDESIAGQMPLSDQSSTPPTLVDPQDPISFGEAIDGDPWGHWARQFTSST